MIEKQTDVEIFCSGWKNTFSLEDTVFAGALSTKLQQEGGFEIKDDATFCAMELWQNSKDDLLSYLEKASHIHRLRKANLDDVFPYTFFASSYTKSRTTFGQCFQIQSKVYAKRFYLQYS